MIEYSEDWSLSFGEPRNRLSEEAAARRHLERHRYTIAKYVNDTLEAVILMTGNAVLIEFFDDQSRSYLSFQFQERKPSRLFLTMATHRKFAGDGNKPVSAVTFTFNEDGSGLIREYDRETNKTKVRSMGQTDISHHWEPYPGFGDYEGLLRIERS